ncbi:MAG: hypothetical protein AAGF76_08240, partial [Pseudomonadota bacterium]
MRSGIAPGAGVAVVYEWEGPVPIGPGFPYNGAYLAYHDRRRAAGASAQRLDFSALIEAYTAAIREPVTARASTGSLSLLGRLAKHLVGRRDGFERAIDRLLENGDTRNGTAFVAGPFPAAGDDQSEEEMEAAIEAALEMLSQRTPPSAPGMVHIGVLDVGIAFVNARFRYREEGVEASVPDKTRFEFLWLQDRTATGADGKPIGHRFLGGTILLRDHIDALIQDHWDPTTGGLDELAIYALFSPKDARRERDVLKTRFAHGTQVLDLMAGYPAEAAASETAKHRPIYAVDLAARVVADTSGGTMPPSALTGLAMLLAASDRDERRVDAPAAPPMVVNISFAYSNGPDDGAHPLVRAIDLLLALAKRYGNREIKATVPMGNHLQDRLHAVLRPEDWADEAPVLTWQVLPDDRTASFIELWSPRAAVAAERPAHVIALQPPDAASPLAAPTAPASCNVFYRLKRHGVEIGRVYYLRYTDRFPRLDAPEAPPGHYQRIIVALRHTSDIVTDSDPAPSGRWGLRVERAGTGAPEEAEPLRLWIARDDTLLTFRPLGRQSHFV